MHGRPKWYLKQPESSPILPFRDYLDLTRPLTLVPAFVVGFAGGMVVHLSVPFAILFGILLTLMQAGGQSLNQSNRTEIEIDRLNGKTYRPTVSGRIPAENARKVAYLLLFSGFIVSIMLQIWLYGLMMLMLAIAYTEQPLYLKRIFPLNLLVQAVSRGFLPIYVLGIMSGVDTVPLAVFSMVWVSALQSTKDFNDVSGDRARGIKTLPIVLGKRTAQETMFLMSVLDYGFAISVGLWFLLFLLPLDIISIVYADKKSQHAENSVGWVAFYTSLGLGTVFGLAGLSGII